MQEVATEREIEIPEPGGADGIRLEVRFEVYNLTDTINLASPSVQLGSANFGQISRTRTIRGDAGSSRQLQFGVKLHF